jgi:hypothetical protein
MGVFMRWSGGTGLLIVFVLVAGLLATGMDASGQSDGKSLGTQAKVTFLQGKADFQSKGVGSWKSLRTGSLLSQDDEVRTAEKSRIEIELPDRSVLRFDQRTNFKMKSVSFDPQSGERDVKVQMGAGKTWANVRKAFGTKKTFEVASANAVAGVRGTVWRMTIGGDQSTLIRVYDGTVEVYNPFAQPDYKPEEGGVKAPREVQGPQEVPPPFKEVTREQWEQIVLTQMMQVTVPATGKPADPSSFAPGDDQKEEWVRWNQQRDREIRS